MIRSVRGGLAASFLCALLSACGGGGDSPAKLPSTVAIQGEPRAEAGTSVSFKTSLADTRGVTFLWDFGDGETGSGATPSHVYGLTGSYTVTVSVANAAEDLRSSTFTVQVGHFSNVAGLDCTGSNGAGWCWQNANVTPHNLDDVNFVPGTNTAWAAGQVGTLLNSTDGGDTWHVVPTGITDEILTVRFRDASHGLAFTSAQFGLQTADGGQSWAQVQIPLAPSGYQPSIVAYDATQIVISSGSGATAVSHDDGLTWTTFYSYYNTLVAGSDCWNVDPWNVSVRVHCSGDPVNVLPLANSSVSTYFVGGSFASAQRGIVLNQVWDPTSYQYLIQTLLTSDGGSTWASTTSGFVPAGGVVTSSVQMIDADHAFLDSYYGPFVTADAGQTWSRLALPADLAQDGQATTRVLAGTATLWSATPAFMAKTSDFGSSWQVIPTPEAAPYNGVSPPRVLRWDDAQTVVAMVDDRLYITHDAGVHWKRALGNDWSGNFAYRTALWFTDAKHGVLVQGNGTIQTTADGGLSWARQDYPTLAPFGSAALQFTSSTDGWLIMNGQLAHSSDGGASWSRPLLPSALGTVYDMSWIDASNGWVTAYDGTKYALNATTDGGQTWTPVTPLANDSSGVWAVRFEDASTGVAIGGAGILRTTDGGKTWKIVGARPNGDTLRHTGAHTFWIVGNSSVSRSNDSGATWTRLDLPNQTYVDVTGSDDRHAWLLRDPNSVLATNDGGNTWTELPVAPDVRVTTLFALDNETVWGATEYGLVFASATGGR
jgi:photosystem II stability/assembly factor-like uncharacterized protein